MIKYNASRGKFGFLTKKENEFVVNRFVSMDLVELKNNKTGEISREVRVNWRNGKGEIEKIYMPLIGRKAIGRLNIFTIEISFSKDHIKEIIKKYLTN